MSSSSDSNEISQPTIRLGVSSMIFLNVFVTPLLKEGETKINEFPKVSPGHHFGQNSPVNVVEFLFRSALPSTENPTFQNPRCLREEGARSPYCCTQRGRQFVLFALQTSEHTKVPNDSLMPICSMYVCMVYLPTVHLP